MLKNRIIILVISFLFLLGCAHFPQVSENNIYAKKYKGISKQTSILLLPVISNNEEFNRAGVDVSANIVKTLELNGWPVVRLDRDIYERKWSEIIQETGGFYSSSTGQFDTDKYYNAVVTLIEKIRGNKTYSAILFPFIELTTAELRGKHAYWDGVKREKIVKDPSNVDLRHSAGNTRWSGETSGVSLKLWAFDLEGEWLFTSYGGLVLPFYTRMKGWTAESRLKVDMFKNSKHIESGVNVALLPIIHGD